MPSRSAHRPSPTVATLVAGLLLACGFLMWGPGHADMTGMAPASAASSMTAHSGSEHSQGEETATGGMGSGCPSMAAMDCPLASAQFPAPPALAAPVPAPLAEELTGQVPASRVTGVECARPRAPDPVSLLCVSRT